MRSKISILLGMFRYCLPVRAAALRKGEVKKEKDSIIFDNHPSVTSVWLKTGS